MNFLTRNSPIFIVGVLGAIVLLVLIIIGQNSETGINLVKTIENTFNITLRQEKNLEDVYFPEKVPEEVAPQENLLEREVPLPATNLPQLEVSFNGTGFVPSSFQAATGQVVRWTNNSESIITIKELVKKHTEFSSGVILEPGASFTLKLYGEKLWTYKEVSTGAVGKILITAGRDE